MQRLWWAFGQSLETVQSKARVTDSHTNATDTDEKEPCSISGYNGVNLTKLYKCKCMIWLWGSTPQQDTLINVDQSGVKKKRHSRPPTIAYFTQCQQLHFESKLIKSGLAACFSNSAVFFINVKFLGMAINLNLKCYSCQTIEPYIQGQLGIYSSICLSDLMLHIPLFWKSCLTCLSHTISPSCSAISSVSPGILSLCFNIYLFLLRFWFSYLLVSENLIIVWIIRLLINNSYYHCEIY